MRVPELNRWELRAHVYKDEEAAKLSLLGGLFHGSGKNVGAGAIHEGKRYVVRKDDKDQRVEIGVAVRLVAATTEWSGEAELTLPNIAASASLLRREARVAVDVVGYAGPLGNLLPSPKNLDVTTCAEYLAAFANIQSQVFSEAGLQFVTPTVIAYNDEPVQDGENSS